MFAANVYRIMIGCPGDILEEVTIAKAVINRWTNVHAEQNGVVLLPINWITNSYPKHGAHPQKILNNQLVDKSDMLIGIFGAKIGSPTDTSQSGTIEEIEEHIKAGKPAMLFFRQRNDMSQISSDEFAKLESFKSSIKNRCLYKDYKDESTFDSVFTDALELFIADNWLSDKPTIASQKTTVQFSDSEVTIIRDWITSDNNTAFILDYIGGKSYVLGNFQYTAESAREEAEWNDFIDRLERVGFIKFVKYNSQGSPVYELQKRAYEQFDIK